MSNFLFSINVTIPIFLVMVIGYFLRQIGMLNENFVTVANKFNFKVTLPFLLFRDLSTVNIQEVFDLKYVLFCAIATSVCFWSVYGLTKIFMKDIFGYGSSSVAATSTGDTSSIVVISAFGSRFADTAGAFLPFVCVTSNTFLTL